MNDTNRLHDTCSWRLSQPGDLTWEVARFYPRQGEWTKAEYLALPTNHLVELANGRLEVLPMPTHYHQLVLLFLYGVLDAFTKKHAPGVVMVASLPVELWPGHFREPDVLYMKAENAHRIQAYWQGADLVMEVVSPSNAEHDRDIKRREYAQAGIPEYWIVDVIQRHILVLTLDGKEYRVHGEFGPGTTATSVLLPGFSVAVDDVLALVPAGAHP
jgi:Uma2 family endonuclease